MLRRRSLALRHSRNAVVFPELTAPARGSASRHAVDDRPLNAARSFYRHSVCWFRAAAWLIKVIVREEQTASCASLEVLPVESGEDGAPPQASCGHAPSHVVGGLTGAGGETVVERAHGLQAPPT